ncbi:MAG: CapA family protein [Polyangiaceae bacterium]
MSFRGAPHIGGLGVALLVGLLVTLTAGCETSGDGSAPATSPSPTSAASASVPTAASPTTAASASPQQVAPIVLVAGGDVSFARHRGQRLLREPDRDDFAPVRHLLDPADLRFVNLETTISDRQGETESPTNKLVFTAPPEAAAALARAHVDIVSLANNHAWDYGKPALLETLDRLAAVGVAQVGAGQSREEAYAPRVVTARGQRVAFVAVTDIWNQTFEPHPGKEHVADASLEELVASVKRARAAADFVVVSHHGGYEYVAEPHEETRQLLRAAVEAGADLVIGHHPHVLQRVAFHQGHPILYSLGNFLMRMVTGKPWTEIGALARVRLARGAAPEVWLCPFRLYGLDTIALGRDPQRAHYEQTFRFTFDRLQRAGALVDPASAAVLGPFDEEGCAPITPTAAPD